MKILLACLILSTLLSSCAVHTPSGSVVVDPNGSHDNRGGTFCPPGQAKKGNC